MNGNQGNELTVEEQSKRKGVPGTLNVILHGVYAFDRKDDEIVAHIPAMGTEHQYKAGTWLAESTLAEHAEIKLEGVTPGTGGFNPKHNIILGDVPVFHEGHACHCEYATLRLPYPSEIKSLRRMRIPAAALGGDYRQTVLDNRQRLESQAVQEVESPAVQVLTYDFADDADLRLEDHPWEPVLQWDPVKKKNYVNLHVFSEPERIPTEDHRRRAFQATMGLFVGVDLTLRSSALAPNPDGPPPAGVLEVELQDLVQRQRWLATLGLSIKQRRDLNTIWDDPTPFAGSDACCGSGCGD